MCYTQVCTQGGFNCSESQNNLDRCQRSNSETKMMTLTEDSFLYLSETGSHGVALVGSTSPASALECWDKEHIPPRPANFSLFNCCKVLKPMAHLVPGFLLSKPWLHPSWLSNACSPSGFSSLDLVFRGSPVSSFVSSFI